MIAKISTVPVLVLLIAGLASAAQFTADIRMVQRGNAIEGKFYARDSVYRMDMNVGGPKMYVMVNEQSNEATIFNVGAQQYMRMPVTSTQIIKTDPIQTARMIETLGAIKNYQGLDTIAGLACDRYIYLRENEPTLEVWNARVLDFPIRIANERDTSSYMELVNIRETPQADSLFAIPSGFTEREKPIPPSSPDAPRARIVKEGTKLRLPLNPSHIVVINLINTSDSSSDCRLTFFAGGTPVDSTRTGGVERCTFHLAAQGDKAERSWDPQADEVLIDVTKGAVAVDIKQ